MRRDPAIAALVVAVRLINEYAPCKGGHAGDSCRQVLVSRHSSARLPETDLGAELGWMEPTPYLRLSHRAMAEQVVAPLGKRGIDPYAPAIEEQISCLADAECTPSYESR